VPARGASLRRGRRPLSALARAPSQAVYARRKRALLKKALELSVLCDSEIGIVVFNSSGQLCQYASGDMERLLERYSKACAEPHERSTNDEVRAPPGPGRRAGGCHD
jgi:MADS-box transcription enhancer factor 2A